MFFFIVVLLFYRFSLLGFEFDDNSQRTVAFFFTFCTQWCHATFKMAAPNYHLFSVISAQQQNWQNKKQEWHETLWLYEWPSACKQLENRTPLSSIPIKWKPNPTSFGRRAILRSIPKRRSIFLGNIQTIHLCFPSVRPSVR